MLRSKNRFNKKIVCILIALTSMSTTCEASESACSSNEQIIVNCRFRTNTHQSVSSICKDKADNLYYATRNLKTGLSEIILKDTKDKVEIDFFKGISGVSRVYQIARVTDNSSGFMYVFSLLGQSYNPRYLTDKNNKDRIFLDVYQFSSLNNNEKIISSGYFSCNTENEIIEIDESFVSLKSGHLPAIINDTPLLR